MVDQFDSETRLAVFNTVTFRAPWDEPFPERRTGFAQFHTPGGDEQVQMMQATDRLHYMEADGVQIVRKKYAGDRDGGETAFYVLLPAKPRDLERLEAGLTLSQLNDRIEALEPENVHLHLPGFILTDQMNLTGMLQSLGLHTAFAHSPEAAADFSGINGERNIFLQGVMQQAKIEVNERETEAVAVTGVFGGAGSAERPAPPIEVRCDRPFLFLIRDEQTGAILFMGRVSDPSN
jgi:serpin B